MKKPAFLLVEMVVAFGIAMLLCSLIARFQRNSWLLIHESGKRTADLDRKIEDLERRGWLWKEL